MVVFSFDCFYFLDITRHNCTASVVLTWVSLYYLCFINSLSVMPRCTLVGSYFITFSILQSSLRGHLLLMWQLHIFNWRYWWLLCFTLLLWPCIIHDDLRTAVTVLCLKMFCHLLNGSKCFFVKHTDILVTFFFT